MVSVSDPADHLALEKQPAPVLKLREEMAWKMEALLMGSSDGEAEMIGTYLLQWIDGSMDRTVGRPGYLPYSTRRFVKSRACAWFVVIMIPCARRSGACRERAGVGVGVGESAEILQTRFGQ